LRYFSAESNADGRRFDETSGKWSFDNASLAQTDTIGADSVGAKSAQSIGVFFVCKHDPILEHADRRGRAAVGGVLAAAGCESHLGVCGRAAQKTAESVRCAPCSHQLHG
jgi:hypothetical protein